MLTAAFATCGNCSFATTGGAAKALAANNAAPRRVQQYNAVPPYRETHAYITRVIADCNRKKLAQPKLQAKPASRMRPLQITSPPRAMRPPGRKDTRGRHKSGQQLIEIIH